MPADKDLKTLTRTPMKNRPAPTVVPESRFAELAGMSDDAVKAKTGKTWKQWVRVLDAADAASMEHRDIARYLSKDAGIPEWWAQGVTVGYERIRGLRDMRQRRGGGYDANKSKTFPVPLSKLYLAFSRKRTRDRWLPGVAWNVSKATTDKSIRLKWDDGNSLVFYFTAKTADKSHVSVQHAGLAAKQDVERVKAFWGERFAELSEIL